jgi:mono/diheme cytochrome c family protein
MKERTRYSMKKCFLLLVAIFTVSISHATEQEGEVLFKEKCDNCHTLERAISLSRDLDAWRRITIRMSAYTGGIITDIDAEKIAQYLTSREDKKELTVEEQEEKREAEKISTMEKHEVFDFKKVRIEQFIDPSVCAECHSELYEQWNGSMHSKAFVDPLWRSATKLFFKEAVKSEEIVEMKACVKCHTPLGFRSYSITSPGDDYEKLADLPAQGIFCNWCHNINEVKHIGDAGYEVEPGGGEDDPSTMLGPFKDAYSDFHPTQYSELHTKSEFCGLCHNVSHAANKLPIEQTYDEWKNSPYNTGDPETTVNCQDCHMRQRPGIPSTGKTERPDNPGTACDGGPQRKHIYTHYFVGANAIVTKMLGSELHAQMAIERLQNAADLELIKNGSYKKNEISYLDVKVINSGAGHYLPTGLTEVRQMWLDVNIKDANGKTILTSGFLDENGEIDRNAVIYNTILGNEKGEEVLNVAKADRILSDKRIPPKGYSIETYALYIPPDAISPLKVTVSLKYRSASQSLAKILLEDNAPEIPVIEMVSLVDTIEF